MPNKKKRVIAAMSGGVDSSVAAAILKEKGYDVVGAFMRMHQHSNPADAKKVAEKLGVSFRVWDVRKEFKKRVIDYFIKEYKSGRTPNPCVECNRHIKFNFLIKKMMEAGAQYVATGHYARKSQITNHKSQNSKLLVARDKSKDQSYFLWTLKQNQLKKILFPVGDYTKKEIRVMAKKWELPVYEKKESQEICFVNKDLGSFLKKYIKTKSGPIITIDGKKIGEHHGLAFYTIGQRKRIGIGGIGPFYVVEKDLKNNTLIVAQSDFNEALFKKEMMVEKVNWISNVKFPLKCNVKIRYLTKAVPASIMKHETCNIKHKNYLVVFDKKQRAITPGQSAVFYKRNEVLGGGIIC